MQVNIAAELGIDLRLLQTERPEHPSQLKLRALHERKAAQYWNGCGQPPVERLQLKQAAAYAYVCVETMRRWVAAGYVACERRGKRILIDKQTLDAYLATRRVTQNASELNKVS